MRKIAVLHAFGSGGNALISTLQKVFSARRTCRIGQLTRGAIAASWEQQRSGPAGFDLIIAETGSFSDLAAFIAPERDAWDILAILSDPLERLIWSFCEVAGDRMHPHHYFANAGGLSAYAKQWQADQSTFCSLFGLGNAGLENVLELQERQELLLVSRPNIDRFLVHYERVLGVEFDGAIIDQDLTDQALELVEYVPTQTLATIMSKFRDDVILDIETRKLGATRSKSFLARTR